MRSAVKFVKGWGFCHKACDKNYEIYSHHLKKVRLTILDDKFCKKIGTVEEDNLGIQSVVNTRKELCGAFVNTMNVTFVNYTYRREEGKKKQSRNSNT